MYEYDEKLTWEEEYEEDEELIWEDKKEDYEERPHAIINGCVIDAPYGKLDWDFD